MASRSPWLHEEEARAQGFELRYELFDFDERRLADSELGPLLHRLTSEGYCGVNVTFPFKQAVIPLLDELAECAEAVGAVNTIAMRDGRLVGYNTDTTGFALSLAEGLPGSSLACVLLLGAGGAGSAVASALLSMGTQELIVADIVLERAEALVERLGHRFGVTRAVARAIDDVAMQSVDGIVNTTPMGMAAHPAPAIAAGQIETRHWVADIVYFPLETELLKIARGKGCRVLNGVGMVVSQAALAFGIMTGRVADRARMQASFSEAVASKTRL